MACINVVMAATDEEANFISTSLKQLFMGIITGKRKPLPPPVSDMGTVWNDYEKEFISGMLKYSFIGSPAKIKKEVSDFISTTQVSEVIATSHIFDHTKALESVKLFAGIMR